MTIQSPNSSAVFKEPGVRRIGSVNWLGLYTLYARETRRFWKVWAQTLAAPAVTTTLFMVIFSLALGGGRRSIGDIPYAQFLAPGLMVMAIIQNAFANTSSSLLIAKVQGNIVDTLMPPLNEVELTLGFALGGVTRGLAVGFIVCLAFLVMPGVPVTIVHIWPILYFSLAASLLLSCVGILTGVWASKFDHAAVITNFVVAPLSLLSGTFYSISRLPDLWRGLSELNPFFYLIDGFRYGFIGYHDSDLMVGVAYMAALNVALLFLVYRVFRTGYKLKA